MTSSATAQEKQAYDKYQPPKGYADELESFGAAQTLISGGLNEVSSTKQNITGEVAILATVVSTAVPGQAVVDAGSKALAKEGRGGDGFGFVLDRPEVLVSGLSEEHGLLDLSNSDWRPAVGDRVHIVPNHVCVSVNLQDALLARNGDAYSLLELEGRGRGPWTA